MSFASTHTRITLLGDRPQIAEKKAEAEEENVEDIHAREEIYNEVDKLVKKRDEQIEEILKEILPEAFAVVKETARRFKENT
jgi:preprotein translocase subunit SecA